MSSESVVLLHGMGRSKRSMFKLEKYLLRKNYNVININYPSDKASIQHLGEVFLAKELRSFNIQNSSKIHFVTHSLGGIIVRQYLQTHSLPKGSKIIMLAPPNKGSEVADFLKDNLVYKLFTGEAGQELTTKQNSTPNQLKAIDYEVGIIAGTKSLEPWLSLLIKGKNDGKVSVSSTKLQEMKDFLMVPHSHTFIMNSPVVQKQIKTFLEKGNFLH